MSGCHNIVQTAQTSKQLDILEGPSQAESCRLVGSNSRYSPAFKVYLALLRFIKTIDAIQQASLTGTVRTNNRQDFIVSYVQADINKGFHAAKGKGEVFNSYLNIISIAQF